jgi:acetyl-CoA C-acetyltransferase/acetyl-CoA acyltransferase
LNGSKELMMKEAYIVAGVRCATGKNGGRLSTIHPVDLGVEVVDALVDKSGVPATEVDDVIFGCVSQYGAQSTNIARIIAYCSQLGEDVPGTTVDRQCGSSQQAIHFAAQAVMSGTQGVIVAGGIECMSQLPISCTMNDGAKAGRGVPFTSKRWQSRYPGEVNDQFTCAEMIADKWEVTLDDLNQFALESHQKGARAVKEGRFAHEIAPIEIELEDGSKESHTQDEGLRMNASLEAIAALAPLKENGLLNAAHCSQISDGAAALMIVSGEACKRLGLKPMAKIKTLSVVGVDPRMMLHGPIPASKKALQASDLTIDDIDLYEINEAFGSIPLAWLKELGAERGKLNVNGGAQALGHPTGASGAKLMVTLVHELNRIGGRYGLLSICEGIGTANATIIERVDSVE